MAASKKEFARTKTKMINIFAIPSDTNKNIDTKTE